MSHTASAMLLTCCQLCVLAVEHSIAADRETEALPAKVADGTISSEYGEATALAESARLLGEKTGV